MSQYNINIGSAVALTCSKQAKTAAAAKTGNATANLMLWLIFYSATFLMKVFWRKKARTFELSKVIFSHHPSSKSMQKIKEKRNKTKICMQQNGKASH